MTDLFFQLADICRREKERQQKTVSFAESAKQAAADRQLFLDSDLDSQSSSLRICLTWLQAQTSNATENHPFSIWLSPGLYIISGFIFGLLTMSGVIAYSGDNPVNIIYWLLIFVVFQWIMMLVTLVAAIIKPGRTGVVAERIKISLKRSMFKDLPQELMPAIFFRMNQWIAVSFLTGATITFLLAIISQDIAFGWATTLATNPDTMVHLVQGLTTPWQSWWIDAVPDAELIRQTLFFRISDSGVANINPQLFGHWWPFLLACLVFYSLIPRIVLLLLAHFQLSRAKERVCNQNALLHGVVQRMTLPHIQLVSHSAPNSHESTEVLAQVAETNWMEILNAHPGSTLLCWRTDRPAKGFDKEAAVILGSGNFNAERVQIKRLENQQTLLWLVPGWEPPIAELKDLLLANNNPQIILLQSLPGSDLSDADQISWMLFVEGLKDSISLFRLNEQESTHD